MAIISLQKGSGKQLKVREKSVNFDMDIQWQLKGNLAYIENKVFVQTSEIYMITVLFFSSPVT